MTTPSRAAVLAGALAALLAPSLGAGAAPPPVPESITYQGVLLDETGAARTGDVDLTVRIYDAPTDGALLYLERFQDVPLSAGVFSVELGPTGGATDSPEDPLTTSLATALGGDLEATSPGRFAEITVGTEDPLPRTQILSVPYAERSRRADSADVADTATTATTVQSLGGVPPEVVAQIFAFTNLDGEGPGNDDPSEGLGDVDGDGRANFVDPDNDGDQFDDSVESGDAGCEINQVNPLLSSYAPPDAPAVFENTIEVQGRGFEPGLEVTIGALSPAPRNVTPTSFEIEVWGHSEGESSVRVTNASGASSECQPGSQEDSYTFGPSPLAVGGATQLSFGLRSGGLHVVSGVEAYAADDDGNGGLDSLFGLETNAGSAGFEPGQIAVTFDPSGTLVGVRCRFVGDGSCVAELLRDSDADLELEDESGVAFEVLPGPTPNARILQPSLAFDSAGSPVVGYSMLSGVDGDGAAVATDRNGDGDFDDANERTFIESFEPFTNSDSSEVAVDASGRVAFVYYGNSSRVQLAHDRNGDGDFDDAAELTTPTTTTDGIAPDCVGADFAPDGDLVFAVANNNAPVHLFRDENGDGDFDDPGEDVVLDPDVAQTCDVETGPHLAVAYRTGSEITVRVDRNDDGDFDDADESSIISGATPSKLELRFGADGRVRLGTELGVFFEPAP